MRKQIFGAGAMAMAMTLALAGSGVVTGCEDAAPTEIVGGVSTQIEVPKFLSHVVLQSGALGSPTFCRVFRVYDGRVQLPRSLGIQQVSPAVAVEVNIYGFSQTEATDEQLFRDALEDCSGWDPSVLAKQTAPEPGSSKNAQQLAAFPKFKLMKRFRSGYLPHHILFAPLPLRYSCYGVTNCTPDETCQAGRCVPIPNPDPATEPQYDPTEVDGVGANCFDQVACLAGAVTPVKTADPCTYRVPKQGFPVERGKLNVRAIFDGAVTEVLDEDPEEGFVMVDAPPTDPGGVYFKLAPGLCDPKAVHPIHSLAASAVCTTKTALQPICSDETRALLPAQNAVYVLIDGTTALSDVRGGSSAGAGGTVGGGGGSGGSGNDGGAGSADAGGSDAGSGTGSDAGAAPHAFGLSDILSGALQDPVFDTTVAEYGFVPENPLNPSDALGADVCGIRPPNLKLAEVDAFKVASRVVSEFRPAPATPNVLALPSGPAPFGAAMKRAYDALTQKPFDSGFVTRAVVLISRSDLGANVPACPASAPADEAKAAFEAAGIKTYVVQLGTRQKDDATLAAVASANLVATSGGTKELHDPGADPTALNAIVSDLSTCVYENYGVNPGPNGGGTHFIDDTGTVRFTTPSGVQTIPHDAHCKGIGQTANGWGVANGSLFVCGAACDTIKAAHAAALSGALSATAAGSTDHPTNQFLVLATPGPRATEAPTTF